MSLVLLALALLATACVHTALTAPSGVPQRLSAVQNLVPTAPPAATNAAANSRTESTPAPSSGAAPAATPGAKLPVSVVDAPCRIIKNANFALTVENSDAALDRTATIAADMGDSTINAYTFFEQNVKGATTTFAVPIDRFGETLWRMRGIAIRVDQESASGQDVTDQFADLESQSRN